jgi:hypothetical protein
MRPKENTMKRTDSRGCPTTDTHLHDQLHNAVTWDVVEPLPITSLLDVEDGDVLYYFDKSEGQYISSSVRLAKVYLARNGVAYFGSGAFVTDEDFRDQLSKRDLGCTRVAKLKSNRYGERVLSWAQQLVS